MIYLPPLRRLLLPSLLLLAFVLYFKSTTKLPTARQQLSRIIVRQPELSPEGERIPLAEVGNALQIVYQNVTANYMSPARNTYYPYLESSILRKDGTVKELPHPPPKSNPYMAPLWECPIPPNPKTSHIKLPNFLHNISLIVKNETENERVGYLNPAIISLPYWSENQYLLVSRVATDGSHQQNLLCEANICYTDERHMRPGEKACSEEDLELQGGKLGFRCATPPITLNVPPTPAENCGKGTGILMDIPGFHDPRIFWTGKGEPLMMVNSQSRYACFGLWLIDLRKLHPPLEVLLSSNPVQPSFGPLMSYGSLTEITRNPRKTRGSIEKNWMMFGSEKLGSYVHYDMGPSKRTFAKLLGAGITTVNLTDPFEIPCLDPASSEEGSWHQGTNSLMLTLCNRSDPNCKATPQNQVFFGIIHHKHKNAFSLPLRYERYVIVWSAQPPFSMLGVSQSPLLLYNETVNGFDSEDNWHGDEEQKALLAEGKGGKGNWAFFTYTVSIAWAWGRQMDEPQEKNVGYLDDEVILGIGVDDKDMVFSRVIAKDLLQCLKACPGRASAPLSEEEAVLGDQTIPGFKWKFDNDEEKEEGKASQEDRVKEELAKEEEIQNEANAAEENQATTKTPSISDIANEAKSAVAAMRTDIGDEIIEEIIEEEIVELP